MDGLTQYLLLIFVVTTTLPNFAILQHPESILKDLFHTNLRLTDNAKLRTDGIILSIEDPEVIGYRSVKDTNVPSTLSSAGDKILSNIVKRKVSSSILENRNVQNFLRQQMTQNLRQNGTLRNKEYLLKLIKLTLSKNNSRTEDLTSRRSTKSVSPLGNRSGDVESSSDSSRIVVSSNPLSNNTNIQQNLSSIDRSSTVLNISTNANLDKQKVLINEISNKLTESNKKVLVGNASSSLAAAPAANKPSAVVEKDESSKISFLGYIISTLTQLPVIGNVLKASVDPLYRPIVKTLQTAEAAKEYIMEGEQEKKNWCFGELGCLLPTLDFYHPLYRPVNLPPYPREQINTEFAFHTREEPEAFVVRALELELIEETSFSSERDTKFIIHGYLNDRIETFILEMVRAFLKHGDYNVITVGWSRGSHALYSQAVANIRVVALETARLVRTLMSTYNLKPSNFHFIGHSLGAHTAGYVGEHIPGIGRITGLDPAEPFFQYMPASVRLDPTDANFVDVIHTDVNSFFALSGPRGFGLEQPVGHIDFYPNGGKEQPGCNQLLTTVPMALVSEGADLVEGFRAGQSELVNCDHVRSAKLFTDSLTSECPYLSFECSSYKAYKEGLCFRCGINGELCAFMGINADKWNRGNETLLKMYLDTNYAPNFCKYHYLLTIFFHDPDFSAGFLRGRLKVSLITEDGSIRKFDLTALSPLKFPRRGSKTFMLEHYEDLSSAQEALLNWTFESDLLDPLSFCVLFCKANLSVASVALSSIDTPNAAKKMVTMRSDGLVLSDEVIMCHKKGKSIMSIPSEHTVKIAASPNCPNLRLKKKDRISVSNSTRV